MDTDVYPFLVAVANRVTELRAEERQDLANKIGKALGG